MKPYKAPRRVKGKRTNKLQIMDHGGLKAYRQGSLEVEEQSNRRLWLSVIPPARTLGGWWDHTWGVPEVSELVIFAVLARYKNYTWEELLDIYPGLMRLFELNAVDPAERVNEIQ